MTEEGTLFELEATHDRAELAALFTELATALETGRPARIAVDDGTASIAFPAEVEVDLEAEADAKEVELELELEWPASADESGLRLEDAEVPPDASPADAGADETPDPASATMSAGGTTDDDSIGGGTIDADASGGRTPRFEVYHDRAEEWRWRLVHWNGNIIADSGEGYVSRYNATRAIKSVVRNAPTARIEQLEE